MAFDYASLRDNVATKLIKDFGKPAIVLMPGDDTGDPYNPQNLPDIERSVTLIETGYSLKDRDASLIQVGDKMGLIAAEGFTPKLDHKIIIGGETYQFVDVQPLNPGGTDMLFNFVARK